MDGWFGILVMIALIIFIFGMIDLALMANALVTIIILAAVIVLLILVLIPRKRT